MKQITDAIVIGAGAIGCATALALTQVGIRRVALVDKGPLLSGMTRRNAGLVHTFQPHESLIRLASIGLETFQQWATRFGGKSLFVETGALVLARTENAAARLREQVPAQQRAGSDTRIVDPHTLASIYPRGAYDGVVLGAYQPRAGYADAVQTTQAFAARAKDHGTQIHTGAMVKRIIADQTRIQGVETTTGSIEAPLVIVATGGWSEKLLAPFGVPVSLKFTHGEVVFVEQPPSLTESHPMFLEPQGGSFLRPHPYRLSVIGGIDTSARANGVDEIDEHISPNEEHKLSAFAASCVPALATAPRKRGHVIVYVEAADGLPILGRVAGMDGLYAAFGFGLNPFALALGVGRVLAQWIVDSAPPIDLSAFDPLRATARR